MSQRHRPAAPTRHQEHIHEDAQVQLCHALGQQGLRRRWCQVMNDIELCIYFEDTKHRK